MIKLKSLLPESAKMPSPALKDFILQNKVEKFEGWLYHGSPPFGLKSMLTEGIYGTQHGEVAEYESFSTSFNSDVLNLFSEGHDDTGLQFTVKDINVLVLDDILSYLVTQLPGSGLEIEVNEEELKLFCQQYQIPIDSRGEPYLPYGYLTSLGIDAFTYEYTWNRINRGYSGGDRDESEICFVGKGIDKLNELITEIYLEGNVYEPTDKQVVLQALEGYTDEN